MHTIKGAAHGSTKGRAARGDFSGATVPSLTVLGAAVFVVGSVLDILDGALARVGMGARAKQRPGSLSGGHQQLVAILAAADVVEVVHSGDDLIRVADVATGAIREVFEETAATQFESGQGAINWRYLPKRKEIIWYSERDNWGQLYLYDLSTGQMKNQITKGEGPMTGISRFDAKSRTLWLAGSATKSRDRLIACSTSLLGTGALRGSSATRWYARGRLWGASIKILGWGAMGGAQHGGSGTPTVPIHMNFL